jgi:hypothetical protein
MHICLVITSTRYFKRMRTSNVDQVMAKHALHFAYADGSAERASQLNELHMSYAAELKHLV